MYLAQTENHYAQTESDQININRIRLRRAMLVRSVPSIDTSVGPLHRIHLRQLLRGVALNKLVIVEVRVGPCKVRKPV
jgi:hypothetical protein